MRWLVYCLRKAESRVNQIGFYALFVVVAWTWKTVAIYFFTVVSLFPRLLTSKSTTFTFEVWGLEWLPSWAAELKNPRSKVLKQCKRYVYLNTNNVATLRIFAKLFQESVALKLQTKIFHFLWNEQEKDELAGNGTLFLCLSGTQSMWWSTIIVPAVWYTFKSGASTLSLADWCRHAHKTARRVVIIKLPLHLPWWILWIYLFFFIFLFWNHFNFVIFQLHLNLHLMSILVAICVILNRLTMQSWDNLNISARHQFLNLVVWVKLI